MSGASPERRIALIGLGNRWRGDDAAGLDAVRAAGARLPAGVEVLELEREPSALLDAWQGVDLAIVVDAVSSGSRPGTVHRLDGRSDPLPSFASISTHALSLADVIGLGRELGRLPARLLIYGIEGERFGASAGLTPAVARAVDRVAEAVEREVQAAAEQNSAQR